MDKHTMNPWELWKQGFNAWESATARLAESWLRNPLVLEPSGALLTAAMKAKAAADESLARWWSGAGLPTRRDQERIMHALNQLESRLHDLEEQLTDRE